MMLATLLALRVVFCLQFRQPAAVVELSVRLPDLKLFVPDPATSARQGRKSRR